MCKKYYLGPLLDTTRHYSTLLDNIYFYLTIFITTQLIHFKLISTCYNVQKILFGAITRHYSTLLDTTRRYSTLLDNIYFYLTIFITTQLIHFKLISTCYNVQKILFGAITRHY